jgi:hypothetical protein
MNSRGCLTSPNPLTAENAKDIRKVRKGFNINHFALLPLRQSFAPSAVKKILLMIE